MRFKAFNMITSESALLRDIILMTEIDLLTSQTKQIVEMKYIHLSDIQFYSFQNLYVSLSQHKQAISKHWIVSSYVGICSSLYTMSLARFLKPLWRINLLLIITSKSKDKVAVEEKRKTWLEISFTLKLHFTPFLIISEAFRIRHSKSTGKKR